MLVNIEQFSEKPSNGLAERSKTLLFVYIDAMKKNIHPIERGLRIVVGLGLVSLAFVGPQSPWFLLGLVPVATGFLGWCPPYQLLGINTCGVKKTPTSQS